MNQDYLDEVLYGSDEVKPDPLLNGMCNTSLSSNQQQHQQYRAAPLVAARGTGQQIPRFAPYSQLQHQQPAKIVKKVRLNMGPSNSSYQQQPSTSSSSRPTQMVKMSGIVVKKGFNSFPVKREMDTYPVKRETDFSCYMGSAVTYHNVKTFKTPKYEFSQEDTRDLHSSTTETKFARNDSFTTKYLPNTSDGLIDDAWIESLDISPFREIGKDLDGFAKQEKMRKEAHPVTLQRPKQERQISPELLEDVENNIDYYNVKDEELENQPCVPQVTVENIYPKPNISYSSMIAMAMKQSVTGQLPVSAVYTFMMDNFPYFRTANPGWKNSVRHNLSLNKSFRKVENDPGAADRKSWLWEVVPDKKSKVEADIEKWTPSAEALKQPLEVKITESDKQEQMTKVKKQTRKPKEPKSKKLTISQKRTLELEYHQQQLLEEERLEKAEKKPTRYTYQGAPIAAPKVANLRTPSPPQPFLDDAFHNDIYDNIFSQFDYPIAVAAASASEGSDVAESVESYESNDYDLYDWIKLDREQNNRSVAPQEQAVVQQPQTSGYRYVSNYESVKPVYDKNVMLSSTMNPSPCKGPDEFSYL